MNFEKDVKEHHHKLKEKIEHLQKTNVFDKNAGQRPPFVFFMSLTKN